MSDERIDCPVPWCSGHPRDHKPDNSMNFHISHNLEGSPLPLNAFYIREDDGPTRLGVDVESGWARELTVVGVRELADQAEAAAVWLRELADQVAALNGGATP
ncbi:hypothetical protein [Agromyces albus]|uniref:hypothetical protein n=1 Tax=Agromyces albus TaxID=205332 RepID=UPI002780A761|nr:hypothetical protein [Agromyces albus]MDQ0576470.1 hypothetical protein [Agromyces albus]